MRNYLDKHVNDAYSRIDVYIQVLQVVYMVMDYDEACCMHLTPGVVHNFPKAVGV